MGNNDAAQARPAVDPTLTGSSLSSRHRPDDVPSESAPAGAAVADMLTRSRQLHHTWRWSPEQRRLRELLRAQRAIGAQFDHLTHAGARVLHARRMPHSAMPLDHIIVTAAATFVVVDLVSTRDDPLYWTPERSLARQDGPTVRLELALLAGVGEIAVAMREFLPSGWRSWIVPVLAVHGPWATPVTDTAGPVTVGTGADLRRWMTAAWVPQLDSLDVAQMTNAAACACPPAVTPAGTG